MPLPKDFQMSKNLNFEIDGSIQDLKVNDSKFIVYPNGEKYEKRKGQTYIDIVIRVESGDQKGREFTQENVNTGVYKTRDGKRSQMYMLLDSVNLKEEVLEAIASGEKQNFDFNQIIGQKTNAVRYWKDDDNLYLDLRDPNFVEKKSDSNSTSSTTSGVFDKGEDDSQTSMESEESSETIEDGGGLFDA